VINFNPCPTVAALERLLKLHSPTSEEALHRRITYFPEALQLMVECTTAWTRILGNQHHTRVVAISISKEVAFIAVQQIDTQRRNTSMIG